MQDFEFEVDMWLLPLDDYDIVLGVQWLATLGDIHWNFKDLTMRFNQSGVQCRLKEIPKSSLKVVGEGKLAKTLSKP